MSDLVLSFLIAIGLVLVIPTAMLIGDARYDRRRLRALERSAGVDVG